MEIMLESLAIDEEKENAGRSKGAKLNQSNRICLRDITDKFVLRSSIRPN